MIFSIGDIVVDENGFQGVVERIYYDENGNQNAVSINNEAPISGGFNRSVIITIDKISRIDND